MAKETEVTIRPGKSQDAVTIHSILTESPEASLWSISSVEDVFDQPGVETLVAERNGALIGFLIGRAVSNEAEILNLAVRVAERRQGYAGEMVRRLFEKLHRQGISRVFLEVRESNATAIGFYQKLGFAQIGRRDGYYRQPVEAALVLEKHL